MASKKGRKSKGNSKRERGPKEQASNVAVAKSQPDEQPVKAESAPEPVHEQDPFLLDTRTKPLTQKNLIAVALVPLRLRRLRMSEEIGPMIAVFAFALLLYGVTAPRYVTLEDDGLFLMIMHHFGVGHPPGYPLYSLLGTPFYLMLPDFFLPAYKGHMFSGFMGALACVAVYAIVAMITRSRACAFAAGIAYAASEAFWSQAIIAEVYTLNAAMFFIIMALCVRFASHKGEEVNRHLALYCLIAFTYGLGLSNHWPLIGLGSIGLVMVVISQWKRLFRFAPLGLLCLAVGLLPYAWLILRSHTDTALNFYGPIEDVKELWFYVTRSGYSGVDQQEGVGIEEKIEFTLFFLNQFQRQISVLGLGIAVVGFVAMLRSAIHSWLAVSLVVAWFMSGPLLIYLINFQTEFIWFSAFRVYHLLCYGITTIFFGYGLAWMGSWLYRKRGKLLESRLLVVTGFVTVVSISVVTEWKQNDRSGYTYAHDLALYKLTQVEPETQLFTFDDLDLPVGYLNLVEGVRPDVAIYNDQGLVFGKRLYSPFTADGRKSIIIENFSNQDGQKPIYYHPFRTELFKTDNNGSDFLGFWRRINPDGNDDRIILSDSLFHWLENSLVEVDGIVDRWTRQQAAGIIATLITAILQAREHGYALSPQWEDLIDSSYKKNELVHLYVLWQNVYKKVLDEDKAAHEIDWINNVLANKSEFIFDNANLADLLILNSNLIIDFPQYAANGVKADYERLLLEALGFEFKYTAFKNLADFYRGEGRHGEAIALLEKQFSDISTAELEFRGYHNLLSREIESGKLLKPVLELNKDTPQ